MLFKKYYELLTVSGQLNQTFNLSKYNHNQKWKRKKTNTKFIIIIVSLVLLRLSMVLYKYIHSLSHEGTDAQIEKNMNLLYLEFLVM
jgi:flagellar basal body-associated protein FliL